MGTDWADPPPKLGPGRVSWMSEHEADLRANPGRWCRAKTYKIASRTAAQSWSQTLAARNPGFETTYRVEPDGAFVGVYVRYVGEVAK